MTKAVAYHLLSLQSFLVQAQWHASHFLPTCLSGA